MTNERENLLQSHAELAVGEFLESESLAEERLPERQYCVFRAGRERFCFSVLMVGDFPGTNDSSHH